MKKAIILLSGGMDSTTCLAVAHMNDYECHALSFRYGQKQSVELEFAQKIAKHYAVKSHTILELPTTPFAGSALTDGNTPVPKYEKSAHIPSTYVPARNTVFLSLALGLAETLEVRDIFIGASVVDYSGYPDCRPEFFNTFEKLSNLATKAGVEGRHFKIHTPLIYLSKAETVALGESLGVNYGMTVSCYQANSQGQACGDCASCVLRKKGFTEAGVKDPTVYCGVEC